LDAISQRLIGHRLFTVLGYDMDAGLVRRLYSGNPAVYPAAGGKTLGYSMALQKMVSEAKPLLSP